MAKSATPLKTKKLVSSISAENRHIDFTNSCAGSSTWRRHRKRRRVRVCSTDGRVEFTLARSKLVDCLRQNIFSVAGVAEYQTDIAEVINYLLESSKPKRLRSCRSRTQLGLR